MSSQKYRNGVQEWDEKLEQCPYYPSHQIRPTRFGHHLLQCRKALSKQPTSPYYHKIDDLAVCRFNSFHHIPRGRMEEHIKKCQGSVTVLKEKPFVPKVGTIDDGISNIMTGMDKLNAAGFDDDEDDWDDDTIQVPAYDPSARADKYCILPAGLTPAERRNFRMEKRLCSNGSSENLSAEAAFKGHLNVCDSIMKELVDKNPSENEGFTPLHTAAFEGHLNVCNLIMKEVLDKNGSDGNGSDENGSDENGSDENGAERTGGATAPIARFRNQKKFADKNPTENESNNLKK